MVFNTKTRIIFRMFREKSVKIVLWSNKPTRKMTNNDESITGCQEKRLKELSIATQQEEDPEKDGWMLWKKIRRSSVSENVEV